MTNLPATDDFDRGEMFALLSGWCSQSLADHETARLCGLLRDWSEARTFYIDYMDLHGALIWRNTASEGERIARGRLAWKDDSESMSRRSGRAEAIRDQLVAARDWMRSAMAASIIISSLVLMIILLSLALIHLPAVHGPMGTSEVGESPVLASLSGSNDAKWRPATERLLRDNGQDLRFGDQLQLAAGLAEITFDTGVKLLLEGPAEFQLIAANQAELKYGKAVAYVPRAARGFAMLTPGIEIVDLGTEFGVQIDQLNATDVFVFTGEVEVIPRGANSSQASVKLRTDQHGRFNASGTASGNGGGSGRFAHDLVRRLDRQPVSLARRHPKIVSYWNCDLPARVLHDFSGSRTGRLEGAVTIDKGLVGSGALYFSGTKEGTVRLPGTAFPLDEGISIELLISTRWEGNSLQTIFRKEDGENRVLFALQPASFMELPTDAKPPQGGGISFGLNVAGYGELDIPLDGIADRPRLEDLCDGEVHHLVATYDNASGVQAIFLDGRLVGRKQRDKATPLIAGDQAPLYLGSFGGTHELLRGVLDEVAVYGAALSPSKVAEHYQRSLSGSVYFDMED